MMRLPSSALRRWIAGVALSIAALTGVGALSLTSAAFVSAQTPQPAPAVAAPIVAPASPAPAPFDPPVLPVEVVARHPHDSHAFTQGLLFYRGNLYESTGREGQSDVRRVDIATGRVLARRAMPADQFGEGMALWRDTLISLTWRHGIANRWNIRTLAPVTPAFRYQGEGWGLATAAEGLVFSDGSDVLRFLNGDTFTEQRLLPVTLRGRPIRQLNELEVVDGRIFANVWMTGFIVVIDPQSGVVTHILDLRPVVAEVTAGDPDAVLNGIAYDPATHRLFVTGKLWPTMYEIRIPGLTTPPHP